MHIVRDYQNHQKAPNKTHNISSIKERQVNNICQHDR